MSYSLGKRKGEPLGRTHYGIRGGGGRGKRRPAAGETLFAETETTSEGEAGAEIPVLRFTGPDLSAGYAGSGMAKGARQRWGTRGGWLIDRTDREVGSGRGGVPG